MSLLYSPPMIRRLCAVLRPASDIFASTSSRADKPQKQIRRKGHLQVRRAVLSSGSISSILPATKTSHSGPQVRHARHKATPAHSTRSKPGYYHLLRASESTAQRPLSASHQAQRGPSQRPPIYSTRGSLPSAWNLITLVFSVAAKSGTGSRLQSASPGDCAAFSGHNLPRVRLS